MNWRLYTVLLAVAVLAGCRVSEPGAAATPERVPSQVLKGFELQDMQNGQKAMTLRAVEGRIYDADQLVDLDQPTVTFFKNNAVSSVMRSPQGRANTQTHVIEAWGGVTVVTADSTTLTTERMEYEPKQRKIFSKTHVKLVKPDSVTEGESLESDPELKRVRLTRQSVRMKGDPSK